jgi:hypothetical protein
MNTDQEEHYWLRVRFGLCERHIETDGKLCHRIIRLRDCPVLTNSLKGENQLERGDEIELWICEAAPGEEVIGEINMFGFIQLNLPPAPFSEFWAASTAADSAARDILIEFKSTGARVFSNAIYEIVKVKLEEFMPEGINLSPKAPPVRVHPVVAELRDMRHSWAESWRGITIGLFAIVAFTLMTALIVSALQALWKWVNP